MPTWTFASAQSTSSPFIQIFSVSRIRGLLRVILTPLVQRRRSAIARRASSRTSSAGRSAAMWRGEPAPTQTTGRGTSSVRSIEHAARRRRAGTARRRPARSRCAALDLRPAPATLARRAAGRGATFARSARRSPGTSATTGRPSQTKTSDLTICAELAADGLGGRARAVGVPSRNSSIARLGAGVAQERGDPLDRLGPVAHAPDGSSCHGGSGSRRSL